MSPIKRLGGRDAQRGTEAEYLSPGRFDGKIAVVTGAGSGSAGPRRGASPRGASVACLDVAEDNAKATVADIEAREEPSECRLPLRRHERGFRRAHRRAGGRRARRPKRGLQCGRHRGLRALDRAVARGLEPDHRRQPHRDLPRVPSHSPAPARLGGSITNVISTAGVMGQPFSAAYCASKGGAAMLTRALAVEYLESDVRVNGVAPGGVDTPLVHDFGFPEGASFKAFERIMTPKGYCTPAEIASAIAFIASDEAAYATGAILSIDGGLST